MSYTACLRSAVLYVYACLRCSRHGTAVARSAQHSSGLVSTAQQWPSQQSTAVAWSAQHSNGLVSTAQNKRGNKATAVKTVSLVCSQLSLYSRFKVNSDHVHKAWLQALQGVYHGAPVIHGSTKMSLQMLQRKDCFQNVNFHVLQHHSILCHRMKFS